MPVCVPIGQPLFSTGSLPISIIPSGLSSLDIKVKFFGVSLSVKLLFNIIVQFFTWKSCPFFNPHLSPDSTCKHTSSSRLPTHPNHTWATPLCWSWSLAALKLFHVDLSDSYNSGTLLLSLLTLFCAALNQSINQSVYPHWYMSESQYHILQLSFGIDWLSPHTHHFKQNKYHSTPHHTHMYAYHMMTYNYSPINNTNFEKTYNIPVNVLLNFSRIILYTFQKDTNLQLNFSKRSYNF